MQSQQRDKWAGYIPTPKRRKLGLYVAPNLKFRGSLADRIDASGGNAACWPWIGPRDKYGYGVTTGANRAHRIVWQEHNGRGLTRDEVVRHTCDNPWCCNPAHLVVGTQDDNVQDRVERGRSARGAMNGRAKLDTKTANAIYDSALGVCEIARRYGVHESTVRNIKSGKTWAWATGHIPKSDVGMTKREGVTPDET